MEKVKKYTKKFFIFALATIIVMLLTTAIIGSIITDRSLDECFFGACCRILYMTGDFLGFTYEEICVIVNIYLEAGLCLLSALWVTWTVIKRCYRELTQLAIDYNTTYNNVNYVIFILLFLVITIGNILLIKLLDVISLHTISRTAGTD